MADAAPPSLLATLLDALEHGGVLPPEDALQRAWEACTDAVLLARIAGRTADPATCAAAQAAAVRWGADIVPPEIASQQHLDWATQEALRLIEDARLDAADCDSGHASARDTLPRVCESLVRAAGLRDWDELLSEAALCEAAPWPPAPEYEAMVERREEAEEDARRALADIVRAHVPCPARP